ncbi:hypothetical protein [Bacillus sp. FJAT-45037]|uniref:hypothetical protein n=1 Tax=Bacillus sp. FJAT-45037 TaxID=2011007 RepID=UPI000C2453BC|nr:hypothetical protein [Bacillus sp. FJAT-45037]
MIEFYLALDERGIDDHEMHIDGLSFIYDQKALEEIGDYLKIDRNPSQGYKLINKNQTLAYGLNMRK